MTSLNELDRQFARLINRGINSQEELESSLNTLRYQFPKQWQKILLDSIDDDSLRNAAASDQHVGRMSLTYGAKHVQLHLNTFQSVPAPLRNQVLGSHKQFQSAYENSKEKPHAEYVRLRVLSQPLRHEHRLLSLAPEVFQLQEEFFPETKIAWPLEIVAQQPYDVVAIGTKTALIDENIRKNYKLAFIVHGGKNTIHILSSHTISQIKKTKSEPRLAIVRFSETGKELIEWAKRHEALKSAEVDSDNFTHLDTLQKAIASIDGKRPCIIALPARFSGIVRQHSGLNYLGWLPGSVGYYIRNDTLNAYPTESTSLVSVMIKSSQLFPKYSVALSVIDTFKNQHTYRNIAQAFATVAS